MPPASGVRLRRSARDAVSRAGIAIRIGYVVTGDELSRTADLVLGGRAGVAGRLVEAADKPASARGGFAHVGHEPDVSGA